jgi:ABC-type lipoprotein export system ATPase subunit
MAIIGNSGSGKSTLLNMIGGLDRPSAGTLLVDGKNLLKFNEKDYMLYKRETVGFIWQNNARNLIPYMTALENIELPMVLTGEREKQQRGKELLDIVGLSHRWRNRLSQLSGGEQQRVSIAIAIANRPKILLADEPTGSVDNKTADMIMDIFRDVNRQLGVTVIIVTHDVSLSRKVDRIVAIRDGRTSSEYVSRQSYVEELRNVKNLTENEQHVELAVVDATGRLQIPREYLDKIGIKGRSRLRVEIEGDRVVVFNPREQKKETEEAQ